MDSENNPYRPPKFYHKRTRGFPRNKRAFDLALRLVLLILLVYLNFGHDVNGTEFGFPFTFYRNQGISSSEPRFEQHVLFIDVVLCIALYWLFVITVRFFVQERTMINKV